MGLKQMIKHSFQTYKDFKKFAAEEGARRGMNLHSNEAVNKINMYAIAAAGKDFMQSFDSRLDAIKYMQKYGSKIPEGAAGARDMIPVTEHTNWERAKSLLYSGDTGKLAKKRIAGIIGTGTVPIASSAAYSAIYNGSPVRDSDGKFDLPGIPGF